MLRRAFLLFVISAVLLLGSGKAAEAQGWSFTFTLATSGPCGATIPQLPIFTIPYMPTKSYCESIRQTIAEISASAPVTNSNGDYIGDCTVFYQCSACTGSDMPTGSSQTEPGSVSINGLVQGNPYFSPHQSMNTENWFNDIVVKLRSLGVPVDGGSIVSVADIPMTDDEDFNKHYTEQMLRFEKPEQGGTVYFDDDVKGVVDPLDLKGTGRASADDQTAPSTVPGTGPLAGTVPAPGSVPEYLSGYEFSSVSSATSGIQGDTPPATSFSDKALGILKELTTNQYAEWVGNLTDEICTNINDVAHILGNPDIVSLSPEDEQRYDVTTSMYKASVTTVTSNLAGEAIGTIVDKSVSAVEYVGEKASIKLCRNVDPSIVKADYKTGIDAGKAAIKVSSTFQTVWGLFNTSNQ